MSTGGQIGNIDLVKQLNSAAVYRLIDQQGPISRIQVADHSQLAPASVTKITRQLLERGLIKEVEQQASTGGRRAISIVTENRPFHSVAVRLGRTDATIALYDLSGRTLVEERAVLPQESQIQLQTDLFTLIQGFINTHQRKVRQLIAVSVTLPGLVDPETGVVEYMPHVSITHWPLADALTQHFGVSCFVGNDVRSLALAEHYFGAGRDCEDSILIRLHRGTGAGIIVHGQIFLGYNRNVGEIGHIQIDPLGAQCHCGNFGCLETVAANSAIEQRAHQLLSAGYPSKYLSLDDTRINTICHAANKGDLLSVELIEQVGRKLGQAIAITVNLFNPQKIIIAGEITEAQKVLFPAILSCIQTQSLKAFRQKLVIVASELYDKPTIGAFALIKRSMLNGILLQRLLDQ
ncbi:MAG: DNA-binding transcriptional regulator NagC [Plesiomonas sp.]|uniref:DNA-binding transcriptional regulator NagC n=1 Tax=Plesiomonas sp. TaxID=2486279 RepID=UPI003F3504E2